LQLSHEEIRSIFEGLCAHKEPLFFVGQYMTFESNFVHFDGEEVYAARIGGGEDALRLLGTSDLMLRFPYHLDFLEANTQYLGLEEHDGKRAIKFALPDSLSSKCVRRSPRIGNLGKAHATFTLKSRRLVRGNMENISLGGARFAMNEDMPANELNINDRIMLTVELPENLSISNYANVRYKEYRSYGVEFRPELSESDATALSDWVFKKQERERELLASRDDLSDQAADAAAEKAKHRVQGGILLVTRNARLDLGLEDLLLDSKKLYRVPPSEAVMNLALSKNPYVAILHLSSNDAAERQLLKKLAENIPEDMPILMLATNNLNETLTETSRECKASYSMQWEPSKALFLHRLVLGILRKHYGHSESPVLHLGEA
jgi:hypothetical protein